ncbi:site-specific integrase [Pseudoalteromonas neustonica]|uniref:Site-specific integrase n=1 Tax=Pseudoalteromonas neustonica TaxID=1840331 RepID=A0ABU9U8F5_9GAMM
MARQKQLISPSFADDDFCLVTLTVERKPEVDFVTDSQNLDYHVADKQTGEAFECRTKSRKSPVLMKSPFLCAPSGALVFPALIFMRSLASQTKDQKTLTTHAQALLLFYRWMRLNNRNIYDCFRDKENGVVYQFRDYLLENVKREVYDNNLKEVIIKGSYTASTCKAYVRTIIRFFSKLHHERIIQFSHDFVPFEFYFKRIPKKQQRSHHDKLSHIKDHYSTVVVETTELTKPFGQVQPIPSHHKLEPMLEDQKQTFYEYLNVYDSGFEHPDEIKNLMLYLATETGLRLEELVTFPASQIRLPSPGENTVSVKISELLNGCLTKFNKERTIEVPSKLMDKLFQYLTSNARSNAIKGAAFRHNVLFVKPSDGMPYATNTIQKHFEKLRGHIRIKNSDWYFTVHDMRATFATDWLYEQHTKRKVLFEILLDELKEIMGHEDTSSTEKYIKYMEDDQCWHEFSTRKNNYIKQAMG